MDDFYIKITAFSCCEYRSALFVVVFFFNFCMFIFIGAAPSGRGGRESQEQEGAGKKEGHTQETSSSTWKVYQEVRQIHILLGLYIFLYKIYYIPSMRN